MKIPEPKKGVKKKEAQPNKSSQVFDIRKRVYRTPTKARPRKKKKKGKIPQKIFEDSKTPM